MLEGLAARLAARRKDQADFQHLVDIVDSGRRAAIENHQAELADLHRQFHVALAEAAANRYLIDLAAPLPAKIDWIFSTTVRGSSSISWNDHSRILEVLSAGDEALAEQIARRHVEDSAEEYLKLLAHGGLDLVD